MRDVVIDKEEADVRRIPHMLHSVTGGATIVTVPFNNTCIGSPITLLVQN